MDFFNVLLFSLPAVKKPTFVKKPENKLVPENGSAKFECKVNGQPPPTISW